MKKKCRTCGKKKLLEKFYRARNKDGLQNDCKICTIKRVNAYVQRLRKDPKNVEILRKRGNDWSKNNPERRREFSRKTVLKARMLILKKYGGNSPKCKCCGESEFKFLAIDHIKGGGSKQRKMEGYGSLGQWLRSKGYPEGYQILCHNCNCAKGFYGKCPHKLKTK